MAWIKSDQSLANHPKLILLARALGISKVEALGHLHLLWYWVLEYADDGELKYLDLIPDACEWSGDQQVFLDALIKYGVIDTTYDPEDNFTEYHVHDWLDYSGALYEKRLYNRLKKQESREKMAKKTKIDDNLTICDDDLTSFASQDLEKSRVEKSRVEESRGRLNKAVKQLKDIEATPQEIELRAKNFVMAYGFHPQPQSITSMWTKLKTNQPKLNKKQLEELQKQALQQGKWVELEDKYGK